MNVTIIHVDDFGDQVIQVAKDVPTALRWFRDVHVTPAQWASFYPELVKREREGLNEDHRLVPAPEFIAAWVGERDLDTDSEGRTVYVYGADTDTVVRVWQQEVI